jgi:hypothetical protein
VNFAGHGSQALVTARGKFSAPACRDGGLWMA